MTTSELNGKSQRVVELEEDAEEARRAFEECRDQLANSGQRSPTQLRKLQEASKYAEARLERARSIG